MFHLISTRAPLSLNQLYIKGKARLGWNRFYLQIYRSVIVYLPPEYKRGRSGCEDHLPKDQVSQGRSAVGISFEGVLKYWLQEGAIRSGIILVGCCFWWLETLSLISGGGGWNLWFIKVIVNDWNGDSSSAHFCQLPVGGHKRRPGWI